MVRHGRQVIAVADSSKLGIITPNQVCGAAQLHTIITGTAIDPTLVSLFQQQQIRVVMV